jgi:hypothetical protein
MQRFWYQLKLAWERFRQLPFVSRRTPVAWLGVLLATVVLLGGLAIALRTPAPGGQPATTSPSGADTTAAGGSPPTTAPPGGGGVPATTGPASDSTPNPEDTGHTLLPPISVTVTLTLPLPPLGDASAGVAAGSGQPAG